MNAGSHQVNEMTGRICWRKNTTFPHALGSSVWPAGLATGCNAYCSRFRQQMGGKSLSWEKGRRGEKSLICSPFFYRVGDLTEQAASLLYQHWAVPFTWLRWLHVDRRGFPLYSHHWQQGWSHFIQYWSEFFNKQHTCITKHHIKSMKLSASNCRCNFNKLQCHCCLKAIEDAHL